MNTTQNKDRKAEMIQRFAQILEKHTSETPNILWLIHYLLDSFELLAYIRSEDENNFMSVSLEIQEMILATGGKSLGKSFRRMASTANSTVILSGRHAETISLIGKMTQELENAIDEFNS